MCAVHLFSFLCCIILSFVFLCLVSCVSNGASVSGLSILDYFLIVFVLEYTAVVFRLEYSAYDLGLVCSLSLKIRYSVFVLENTEGAINNGQYR
jgi:hypothetical protein